MNDFNDNLKKEMAVSQQAHAVSGMAFDVVHVKIPNDLSEENKEKIKNAVQDIIDRQLEIIKTRRISAVPSIDEIKESNRLKKAAFDQKENLGAIILSQKRTRKAFKKIERILSKLAGEFEDLDYQEFKNQ